MVDRAIPSGGSEVTVEDRGHSILGIRVHLRSAKHRGNEDEVRECLRDASRSATKIGHLFLCTGRQPTGRETEHSPVGPKSDNEWRESPSANDRHGSFTRAATERFKAYRVQVTFNLNSGIRHDSPGT